MKAYGNAYCDFATKLKQIDMKKINMVLLNFLYKEAIVLDRVGRSYKELASNISMDNPDAAEWAEAKAEAWKDLLERIHTEYDTLRTKLGECFETELPTVEQTREEDKRIRRRRSSGGKARSAWLGGRRPPLFPRRGSRFRLPHLDQRQRRIPGRRQVSRRDRRSAKR